MSFTQDGADRISKAFQDMEAAKGKGGENGQATPTNTQDAQPETEVAEPKVEETTTEQVAETKEPVAEETETHPENTETDTATEEPEVPVLNFGEEAATDTRSTEELNTYIGELKQRIQELEESKSNVFANEQAEAINAYLANGGEFNEAFFKAQTLNTNIDYNNEQSMIDALKNKYILLDGFSEADAQAMVERKFEPLFDRDLAEDKDIRNALLDLKITAKEVQPKLEEFKSKTTLPTANPQDIAKQQEEFKRFQMDMTQELSAVKEFDYELKDGFNIKATLDKNTHSYVSSLLLNPENLHKYFQDNYMTDGKVDVGKFARDQFNRIHFEKLIKQAYAQGESAGQKLTVQRELRQESPSGAKRAEVSQPSGDGWKASFISNARKLAI